MAQEETLLAMPLLCYASPTLFLVTLGPTAITWQLSGGATGTQDPQRFYGILMHCEVRQLRFAAAV